MGQGKKLSDEREAFLRAKEQHKIKIKNEEKKVEDKSKEEDKKLTVYY